MARQSGILQIEGTIDNLTFTKTRDGFLVKRKGSVPKSRIKNSEQFVRTRENIAEFRTAAREGKTLRRAVKGLLQYGSDGRMTSRLLQTVRLILETDATSLRGERSIANGAVTMLKDFEFNANAKLDRHLAAPFTVAIDRALGTIDINLPTFIPADALKAPAGATHFRIGALGAEVDFTGDRFVTGVQESAILAIDRADTRPLALSNTVTANSTLPLFALLGVQFFQEVNGIPYPLNNGGFSALKILEVDAA
jgi:hypothetical protein